MAEERVEFKDAGVRKEFFQKLKEIKGVDTWEELYDIWGTGRATFQYYRNGKFLTPRTLFDFVIERISPVEKAYFEENVVFKERYWGAILGGKTTCVRHPENFEKATRRKCTYTWGSPRSVYSRK